jgi:predicted secreted hydrolase
VNGTSWFDQEWASNQLTPQQVGWNWFALHLADGTELMLYQMRLRDRRTRSELERHGGRNQWRNRSSPP